MENYPLLTLACQATQPGKIFLAQWHERIQISLSQSELRHYKMSVGHQQEEQSRVMATLVRPACCDLCAQQRKFYYTKTGLA